MSMRRRAGNPDGLVPDGQKIRELREDCGLTAAQLARAIGCRPEHISRIELHGKRFSKTAATRIANTLSVKRQERGLEKVTREEILAGSDEGEQEPEPKALAS